MKILVLANNDVGLYNFRKELLQALLNKGYSVYISLPYDDRVDELVNMGCIFEQTDVSRHGTNPITDLKLCHTYIRLIKKIKPDIVFSYTIKPNIYGGLACKHLKIPYVVNITGLGTAVENGGMLQKFIVAMYKIALNKAQKIFFQNKENMNFFTNKKIAMGRYDLLPGSGVNLNKFIYSEYPIKDTIEFAFVSRIMKEKGIDQYLDAAKAIRSKYPNTVFHVCGFCEQEYESVLNDLNKSGIIIYHGMVSDVKGMMQKMHCIVHPTYYPEGLSNVLLEASACGRPIITTDRSGCREVIEDGKNGYICKQQDSNDLINKIDKFINLTFEQRRDMGIYGRKKVEKEFDRQIVVDKYMEEIEKIQK